MDMGCYLGWFVRDSGLSAVWRPSLGEIPRPARFRRAALAGGIPPSRGNAVSYWINDRLGIAFESNEGGIVLWDSTQKDSAGSMPSEEIKASNPCMDCRRCSEDEAFAYMEAKDAEHKSGK